MRKSMTSIHYIVPLPGSSHLRTSLAHCRSLCACTYLSTKAHYSYLDLCLTSVLSPTTSLLKYLHILYRCGKSTAINDSVTSPFIVWFHGKCQMCVSKVQWVTWVLNVKNTHTVCYFINHTGYITGNRSNCKVV